MDYIYKCKKCGQEFHFDIANHTIEVKIESQIFNKACRGEIVKIEESEEINA